MNDDFYNLFVYGTLKKGQVAHYLLRDCEYLGSIITTKKYSIYKGPHFPAVIEEDSEIGVVGEVYRINKKTKERLDRYEGVEDNYYKFVQIDFDLIKMESGLKEPIKINDPVYAYIFTGNLENFKKVDFWY